MTAPGFASSKAIDRFRILQSHLEEDVPLARMAAELGVAERTLRRWLAAWRAKDIHGLERAARRSDTGKRRRLDPDLEALVRSMATSVTDKLRRLFIARFRQKQRRGVWPSRE